MGLIDLHAHTSASDGALAPERLVRLARAQGVSVLAVTDHDTLAAIPAARAEAATLGLQLVPGVEVTAYAGDLEVHILGHFVEPDDPGLAALLASSRADRLARIRRMIDRLWALGLPLSSEEILAPDPEGAVGRPHLAQAMVRRGYVTSVDEAFDRYLAAGRPAHVERARLPAATVIETIRRAGGVPSLAHPGVYRRDGVIEDLVRCGLMGLEVRHPDHDPEMVLRYERVRLEYGLLMVGGSDYHGVPGLRHSSPGRPSVAEAEFERLVAAVDRARTDMDR
jgi:hypothetical protein